MSHTKEPWRVGELRHKYDIVIRDADGGPVALGTIAGYPSGVGEANARRIVACVNALSGVPTEWLESFRIADAENVAQQNARLTQQRDKLLEALIHIQQVACSGSPELYIATEILAEIEATK